VHDGSWWKAQKQYLSRAAYVTMEETHVKKTCRPRNSCGKKTVRP
jgi:hypothetical protein